VSSLHSYKSIALQNLLKFLLKKSLILSCDTVVANERYNLMGLFTSFISSLYQRRWPLLLLDVLFCVFKIIC